MSRESVLDRGRAMAEAGMLDTCLIQRQTGSSTSGGVVTPTYTTVYSGRCRVQETSGYAANANPTPDQPVYLRHRELQLPVATSGGIRVGDKVTITACVADPDLVNRVHSVRDLAAKSEATSRRIGIEETTG